MKCPQCLEETPDDGLNCAACHINLYWAKNHYEDLARVRSDQGLNRSVKTSPTFLIRAHDDAVAERRRHPEEVARKMRIFARKKMDAES
ncbi:MAG TPA: hypothetical protein VFV02_05220 [Acidimicrobiales bacterium]|nr:hypothetical protein [Acidimicrobiales bacterium]